MVAALSAWHEQHDSAARQLAPIRALPAHVLAETYAVLTRLPSGLAVPGTDAARALAERFSEAPLSLDARLRRQLLPTLAASGIFGGATYDGLIALEARAHDRELLTLDQRALSTYQRLGVPARLIAG